MDDSAMSDCADEAETGEEETPTDADPCVEPASHSKKEKKKGTRTLQARMGRRRRQARIREILRKRNIGNAK
jgi:hypothetical protein